MQYYNNYLRKSLGEKIMSDQTAADELAGLDRVLLRLATTEDEKLEKVSERRDCKNALRAS